ncbi:hypothetical protein FMM02_10670 [Sphingomonas xanthus]|uniref:Uncharacterized protein n=1 Tax=Sphingomonas xanthus TaxID=2594473 RepID=A0A516ITY0_9SPHN|nr:hypothetical protein FMM02_10670 [Sphingomonas xanthus]
MSSLIDRFRFLFFGCALALFPDGAWGSKWTRRLVAAIIAAFVLGLAEAIGISSTSLYLPIAIGCILATLAALTVKYRLLGPGTQKQQLKWVMLGLVCGIGLILSARAGALLKQSAQSAPFSAIVIEGLFQFGIVVVALGFLTSLLRFRLYDAEAAISRSAVYATMTLTLVGTFAASETLVELAGEHLFGMAIGNISGAAAAGVAAMMLTPLHGRISDWAERQFQNDLVMLKQDLPDLLASLSSGCSVKQLASNVLPRIEQAVQSTCIALLIDGKLAGIQGVSMSSARRFLKEWQSPETTEEFLRCDHERFPLRLALRCPLGLVRGWLLLGSRPDGSFYGRDDVDALLEVLPLLQRSVFHVAQREKEGRRRQQLDRQIMTMMRSLSERLSKLECALDHHSTRTSAATPR